MKSSYQAVRDAELVRLHIDEGLNFAEIGARYGISRERVRQIVAAQQVPCLTRSRWAAARAARQQEREARRDANRAYRESLDWLRDRSLVDENGCWIWQRAIGRPNGYGHVAVERAGGYAHRVAWEIANGAIPDTVPRLCVCHKCDVPACVNPDHLFLGTHKDNVWDSIRKGRRPSRLERAA